MAGQPLPLSTLQDILRPPALPLKAQFTVEATISAFGAKGLIGSIMIAKPADIGQAMPGSAVFDKTASKPKATAVTLQIQVTLTSKVDLWSSLQHSWS